MGGVGHTAWDSWLNLIHLLFKYLVPVLQFILRKNKLILWGRLTGIHCSDLFVIFSPLWFILRKNKLVLWCRLTGIYCSDLIVIFSPLWFILRKNKLVLWCRLTGIYCSDLFARNAPTLPRANSLSLENQNQKDCNHQCNTMIVIVILTKGTIWLFRCRICHKQLLCKIILILWTLLFVKPAFWVDVFMGIRKLTCYHGIYQIYQIDKGQHQRNFFLTGIAR